MLNLEFYKNRKVLITGNTGFKGSWLSKILTMCGAIVVGYSLKPPTNPSLYELSNISKKITFVEGDIRDFAKLKKTFEDFKPEIVIHMAAQPIVRESYKDPLYTYETNVMGTVNVCECVRLSGSVKSFLNVTTDKVYLNKDLPDYSFGEEDPLDGFDPYSNSKSCSELVTHSYNNSFFKNLGINVSTARAGNVIGGGDFAKDRIVPDCIRAIENSENIIVRNPFSVRPYQHVLEPLFIYLEICEKQYYGDKYCGSYNIGPDEVDCVDTGTLVSKFCNLWGNELTWINKYDGGPHEANFLRLNNAKLKHIFGWKPTWHIDETLKYIVDFTKIYLSNPTDIEKEMEREIKKFYEGLK